MSVMLVERRVVRIDRSPMNPKRWCFTLECGHEVWQSWTRKPKRTIMACDACVAKANAQ